MENSTVQTDLAQMLIRLESKIDKLDGKIDNKIDKLDEKIDNKIDKLDSKIDKLDGKIETLALNQAELKGDIKALDTKTDQIDKRIANQEFLNRGVFLGLLLALLGQLLSTFGWMPRS